MLAPDATAFCKDIDFEVEGIGETLVGLSDANLDNIPADAQAIPRSLGHYLKDLAARVEASREWNYGRILRSASVVYTRSKKDDQKAVA